MYTSFASFFLLMIDFFFNTFRLCAKISGLLGRFFPDPGLLGGVASLVLLSLFLLVFVLLVLLAKAVVCVDLAL